MTEPSPEPSLRLRAIALLTELCEFGETPAPARETADGLLFHDARAIDVVEAKLREAEERGASLSAEAIGEPELRARAIGFGNVLRQASGPRVGFALLLVTRDGAKAYASTLRRGIAARLMQEQVGDWAAEAMAADAGPPAWHVLHEGRTLCGQFAGLIPINWPEGHKWVRLGELERVTCARCIAAASLFTLP